MKKETPVYVEMAQVCAVTFKEKENVGDLMSLAFDDRRDILIDDDLAGIVVKVSFVNRRYYDYLDKGARRIISYTLVDETTRVELMSKKKRINISAKNPFLSDCCEFTVAEVSFESGHAYKVVIRDDISHDTVKELRFHAFGRKELGHPSRWYKVTEGGLRPSGNSNKLFRSLNADDISTIYVKFNLEKNRDIDLPAVLPELELRVHIPGQENDEYKEEGRVEIQFSEPGLDDNSDGRYTVELSMCAAEARGGIYYAELLCMQFPIAGFVFTLRRTINNCWMAENLIPLEEYSEDAANGRFIQLEHSPEAGEADDRDEFEKALDDFILGEKFTFPEWNEELGRYVSQEEIGHEVEDDLQNKPVENDEDGKPLLAPLDHLTGLRAVKEKLTVYERVVRFNKMRADLNLPVPAAPLHAMFLGAPGTGKSTVARMMGLMLRRAGLLSKGHVVVKERATLLGQNYNSEAEKTLDALREAEGGILFIDEAYQLYQANDPRDPGKFVIETLLTALADDSRRDWMLILAGYPDQMKRMFDMNPGFRSRIPDSNIYRFDDFTESELMEIAENYLDRHKYVLSPEARNALSVRFRSDYRQKDNSFGNARYVLNLIQTEILPAMAVRVIDSNSRELSLIEACDIPSPVGIVDKNSNSRIGFRA